jgi:hypothetical protein
MHILFQQVASLVRLSVVVIHYFMIKNLFTHYLAFMMASLHVGMLSIGMLSCLYVLMLVCFQVSCYYAFMLSFCHVLCSHIGMLTRWYALMLACCHVGILKLGI